MNMRIVTPVIASLALFASNPASALGSAGDGMNSSQIETATIGVMPGPPYKAKYPCRRYANYHARSRCRQIRGIPDPN
jgi:hypothetical protein